MKAVFFSIIIRAFFYSSLTLYSIIFQFWIRLYKIMMISSANQILYAFLFLFVRSLYNNLFLQMHIYITSKKVENHLYMRKSSYFNPLTFLPRLIKKEK